MTTETKTDQTEATEKKKRPRECISFRKGEKCEREKCDFVHACGICESMEHSRTKCPDKLPIVECKVCELSFPESSLAPHLAGAKHRKKLNSEKPKNLCDVCNKEVAECNMEQHNAGKVHKAKAAAAAADAAAEPAAKPAAPKKEKKEKKMWTCEVCDITMEEPSKEDHLNGKKHKVKARKAEEGTTDNNDTPAKKQKA